MMPEVTQHGWHEGQQLLTATYCNESLQITFCNIGASIVSLMTKDGHGEWADIVLGYEDVRDYLTNTDNYMGGVVGRCANRIRHGQFHLNGRLVQLTVNNGLNHLHGGDAPFNTKVWQASFEPDQALFTLVSPDGDGQYPGSVRVQVSYRINNNELIIAYKGQSDQDTLLNLTNHSYFNLDGHDFGSLKHHLLQVDAELYVPIDESLIPTGELRNVADTAFDFRQMKELLSDIECEDEQLHRANGYDHTFSLHGKVVLMSRRSQRSLTITTNMPGVQVYSGNYLNCTGKNRAVYGFRSGIALETQYFPDSVNQPNFASCVRKADQPYYHEAKFVFDVTSQNDSMNGN